MIFRKSLFRKQTQLKGKHFPENQVKFFFDWNWLENVFRWPECIFRWPESVFRWPEMCFPLTGKCFPLTNFPNDKQTQKSLENNFLKSIFRKTNIALMQLLIIPIKKTFHPYTQVWPPKVKSRHSPCDSVYIYVGSTWSRNHATKRVGSPTHMKFQ